MPQRKPFLGAVTAVALTAAAIPAAAADVERGRQAAQPCIACHQADGAGNAALGYPRLDLLAEDYIIQQLQHYKAGHRQNPIMQPFARNLNEQQMADIAAYYGAQQAAVPTPPATDAALLAQGEKLVHQGDWDRHIPACTSCHGPDNRGVGASFPALAGQHASYIESQLQAWRNGTRSHDPLNLMLAVAGRMTDSDIKAAAAYLAAQPAK